MSQQLTGFFKAHVNRDPGASRARLASQQCWRGRLMSVPLSSAVTPADWSRYRGMVTPLAPSHTNTSDSFWQWLFVMAVPLHLGCQGWHSFQGDGCIRQTARSMTTHRMYLHHTNTYVLLHFWLKHTKSFDNTCTNLECQWFRNWGTWGDRGSMRTKSYWTFVYLKHYLITLCMPLYCIHAALNCV